LLQLDHKRAGCGTSFPKKGEFFPRGLTFAEKIAAALTKACAESGVHVKTVAGWTGANERTVKNWFSGTYGPSGEHLLILARHCDEVLDAMIVIVDRRELLVGHKISEMERCIRELAEVLGGLKRE
jgi:hypothetical protein